MLCYLLNIVQKLSPVALAEEGREMQPAGWLFCRVKHCWNQQKGAKKSVWHPVKTKKLLLQEASWQGIRAHTLKQVASWAAECVNPLPVSLPPWAQWCLIKNGLMSTNENPLLCLDAYFHEIYRNTVALGLLPPHQLQVKLPSGFKAQRRNPWQIDWWMGPDMHTQTAWLYKSDFLWQEGAGILLALANRLDNLQQIASYCLPKMLL